MPSVPYSLQIDLQLKERIEAEARRENRPADSVIQQAASDYLDRKAALHKMIEGLEAEADKGVFISEEAMTAWVRSWDTDNELPEPQPDVFLKPDNP